MRVDVEIVAKNEKVLQRVVDSAEVMPQLLQQAGRVGGARCLPRIDLDRPTEFPDDELASLFADLYSLQEVSRGGALQAHLASLLDLLHGAIGCDGCKARFIPYERQDLDEDLMNSGLDEETESYLEVFGHREGECSGCDSYTSLDDIGLCEACSAKLDRDMIRERDWERSVTAWSCPEGEREKLRSRIIKKHGAKLELIAPSRRRKTKSKPPKQKRRKEPET